MSTLLAYIGPGLGLGTIALIVLVLFIILVSVGFIIWIPIKRFIQRVMRRKS